MMIVITGGIGAGKSAVLAAFRSLGAHCADADDLAHQLYAPGTPLLEEILAHFGEAGELRNPDGSLNRAALAKRVFADAEALSWLNQAVHPCVRAEFARLEKLAFPEPLFAAIPLWYESGWPTAAEPTKVIAVWCPPETQRERLRMRGWDDAEIQRRLHAQLSMDEKRRRADYVIETTGSLAELREKCAVLLKTLAEGV